MFLQDKRLTRQWIQLIQLIQLIHDTVDTVDTVDGVPGQDVYGVDVYISSRGAAQGPEGVLALGGLHIPHLEEGLLTLLLLTLLLPTLLLPTLLVLTLLVLTLLLMTSLQHCCCCTYY